MMNMFVLLLSLLAYGAKGFNMFFPGDTSYEVIYKGPTGQIRHKEGSVFLACSGRSSVIGFPPLKQVILAEELTSFECLYPAAPIADSLKALNIDYSTLKTLSFTSTNAEPLPAGNYTVGLNLTTLSLENPGRAPRDYYINNPDFLEPLTSLKSLTVSGTTLLPIPEKISVESLTLGLEVIVKSWGNCRHLKEFSIRGLKSEDQLLADWPSNCSQLISLVIVSLSENVANRFISSTAAAAAQLRTLNFTYCNVKKLPMEVLNVAKDMNFLSLMSNNLNDDALLELPMMKNLTVLDLSNNKIVGLMLNEVVKQVPFLRTLILDNNLIISIFCTHQRLVTFSARLPMLQQLSLNGMNLNVDCFKQVHFSNLTSLSLSTAEKIATIEDFPTTDANRFEVDLRRRIVTRVKFEYYDYDFLKNGNYSAFWKRDDYVDGNFSVLLDNIDCDCENYWLSLTIRENISFTSFPDLKCRKTGTKFIEEDLNAMDCNIGVYDKCVIRTYPTLGHVFEENGTSFKTSEVECHDLKIPDVNYPLYDDFYRITGLNLSGNSIGSLSDFDLPDSVQWLDLRGNVISRLFENETMQLFIRNRRVWLSRNLFICDCENAIMLDLLHDHRDQIMDFDSIICIDSEKPMNSITSYEACQIEQRVIFGILGAILAVMMIIVAVLWRYRFHVKIYLYSRGWCISCLSQHDEDPDRPYDVFLSFSHGDLGYVTDELLPKLESEPVFYRVCVHYRDWVVGDWIPNQIMRSVSLSKRTIIILSKNFINSLWGSLEFRYALASGAKEGRPRLLVLVLDDVLDETLDEELRGYLHYNTYLRCDDPWFWEKLRYAMPHRKDLQTNATQPPPQSVQDIINSGAYDINMEPLA